MNNRGPFLPVVHYLPVAKSGQRGRVMMVRGLLSCGAHTVAGKNLKHDTAMYHNSCF